VTEPPEPRDDYRPFDLGARFRIVPPHVPALAGERIVLLLPRGAFGSGEHETTASCIEVLETLPEVSGARVLDLGSGTAILAVAALKLGAKTALCVDDSPRAIECGRRCCELNGVAARVTHLCGTLADVGEGAFDLALANVYADVLLDVAGGLLARAEPKALLLLSGIPWEDNFELRRRYERLGCTVLRNRMLEEYSTVLLRKGPG
jgi:ribosomal protein L11 methyltransferase